MKNRIELTMARGYADLDARLLRWVAFHVVRGTSPEELQVKAFIRFTGIRPVLSVGESYFFVKPKFVGFFSMKVVEVNFFAKKLEWITQQFIGINPPATILGIHRCDALLRDTAFIQYLDAENHYQAYLHTKDEKYLIRLFNTLYQKGDQYSNNIGWWRSFCTKHLLSATDKTIILFWMMGVKERFAKQFPNLFEAVVKEDDDDATPININKIIRDQVRLLSGGDITKEKAVLAAKTWSALSELDAKCKESKESQKK